MSLKILKAGLQSSIQDLGRKDLMQLGVAQSGAMDPISLQLANWLVGNKANTPAIEMTIIGAKIEFNKNLSVAITGAQVDVFLNVQPCAMNCTINVKKGDVLEIGQIKKGARVYLAIAASIDIPQVLSSYATNLTAGFGGFFGRQLHDGDNIKLKNCRLNASRKLPQKFLRNYTGNYRLRCCFCSDSHLFDFKKRRLFFSSNYQISSESNRMGLRLISDEVNTKVSSEALASITSSGLPQGNIQITGSGQAIIAAVDGQTVGGYPRIATIIRADLPLLGQLKAGDKINFSLISRNRAISYLKQQKQQLEVLS